MCELCIEELILSFIPRTIFFNKDYLNIARLIPDAYLQESEKLETAISDIIKSECINITKITYLCKMIEEFVNEGYNRQLYMIYRKIYKDKEIYKTPIKNNLISMLIKNSTYASKSKWEFVENISTTNNIKFILEYYIAWWIDQLDTNNQDRSQACYKYNKKVKYFNSIFIAAYYSLCYSMKYNINIQLIERIALRCPGFRRPSQFAADDLWLQRKALQWCIKRSGSNFLLNNIKNISENHIHYILSKFTFSADTISKIKKNYIDRLKNINSIDNTSQQLIESLNNLQTKYLHII